jgi:hypothetical protein
MKDKKKFWDIYADSKTYRSFIGIKSLDLLYKFRDGKVNLGNWKVLYQSLYWEEGEDNKPISDFMSGIETIISASERARNIIKPIVNTQVEFLPINTEIGNYYAMNVKEIDCLDKKKSLIRYFDDGKRILHVVNYAFYMARIEGINIFRIKGVGLRVLVVNNDFKNFIEHEKLSGLIFLPLHIASEN